MNPREMRYQPNAQFPTIGAPPDDQMLQQQAMIEALRNEQPSMQGMQGMQPAMSAPEFDPLAAKPQPGLTQGAPMGTGLGAGAGTGAGVGFGAQDPSLAKPEAPITGAPVVGGSAPTGDPSQVLRQQILQAILSQQGGGVLK